jgi:SAM-dependent methyltransferase
MQDLAAERKFYAELFAKNPENEHITSGYDELHQLAMPVVPKGTVMDIGCGTGAHTVRLARRGCDVVAMDLTREGVKAARERLRRENLKGRFVVGDAENLPFRDQSAEVAWTFLLLHHFPKLDKLPQELSRVTRDRILALEPNAQNALTWLFNNVINKFLGTEAMTVNQRALWPGQVTRAFAPVGFEATTLVYVDRRWSDGMGWARKSYDVATMWLPKKFRVNKFLVILQRRAR